MCKKLIEVKKKFKDVQDVTINRIDLDAKELRDRWLEAKRIEKIAKEESEMLTAQILERMGNASMFNLGDGYFKRQIVDVAGFVVKPRADIRFSYGVI